MRRRTRPGAKRMSLRKIKAYRWPAVYTLIVEDAMAGVTQDELSKIDEHLEDLVKIRDELVRRIEKSMMFLATLLIFIALVEANIITTLKILGLEFTASQTIYFVFFGLVIGNLVALLNSTAMFKMFIVESLIEHFIDVRYDRGYRRFIGILVRFFAFSYKVFFRDISGAVPAVIARLSAILHRFTVVLLPFAYILCYLLVLVGGLEYIKYSNVEQQPTSHGDQVVPQYPITQGERNLLFGSLLALNFITLPIHLFTFFPVPIQQLSNEEYNRKVSLRAYELWEESGRPVGRDVEQWFQAEREIRDRIGARLPVVEQLYSGDLNERKL
jgi:hypothetical protein